MDHKEGWAPKKWCFQTVVLEKILESPLDIKEIKPVNPKGSQPWILTVRTDTEAAALILWSPDMKSLLIGKILMLGKIECRRRRGWQRMRCLDGITDSMDLSLNRLLEMTGYREAWYVAVHGLQRVRHDWVTEQKQQEESLSVGTYHFTSTLSSWHRALYS